MFPKYVNDLIVILILFINRITNYYFFTSIKYKIETVTITFLTKRLHLTGIFCINQIKIIYVLKRNYSKILLKYKNDISNFRKEWLTKKDEITSNLLTYFGYINQIIQLKINNTRKNN